MIKDKRGSEYIYMYIFYTLFIMSVLAILIYWTNDVAKNEDFKRQVIAKQIALVLDAAAQDTKIDIQTEDVNLTLGGGKINVKKNLGFSYNFYSPYINILEKKQQSIFLLKVL